MAAAGGIPLHFIAGSEHDGVPAWSPDGHWIAFASQRNGKSEIYKMRADGSQQTALGTNLPGWHPTWSPDGKQIAFSTSSDIQYPSSIYKMNTDGTEQIPLSDTSAHDIDPSWSPDGQHIAFVSHYNDKDVIYTMNSDGSARIPLTNASANDGNPAWSPNGQQIA